MATDTTKNIAARLADIQKNLHAPKSQRNEFGGFNYRSCEDILQSVKPLLEGLVILIQDDIVQVADRIYVKATATLTDGEQSISTTAFARESLTKKGQDDSQITGATSSYARKYALNGLLLIDDNKDADAKDNRNHQAEVAEAAKQQEAQQQEEQRKQRLMDAVHKHQGTISAIKKGIASGDYSSACEAWCELTDDEKQSIWVAPTRGGPFTTEERKVMQTREFRESYFGATNEGATA